MTARLHLSRCPHCGAPLDVAGGAAVAICVFCNASLRVERPAAGAPADLTATEVPAEEIERVKQLLLDGQREEAIAHYARVARVPRAEAEAAVEGVSLSAYWELTRDVPINAVGALMLLAMAAVGAVPAALAAAHAGEAPLLWGVVALGGALALWASRRLARHLRATAVASFGATGRGAVLKCAVLRPAPSRGGVIAVVLFEVTPDAGGAPFVDQETLLVSDERLGKLAPGTTVRVRFDGARGLVFPVTPVTVL